MDFRKAVFQIYCVILYINHFSKEGFSRYSCSPATHKRDGLGLIGEKKSSKSTTDKNLRSSSSFYIKQQAEVLNFVKS
jgi:hypothetical protein